MLTPPNEYDCTVLYSKKDYEIWRIREVSSDKQISQILKKENINMALLYPETAGHVISIIIKGKLWTKVSGHSRVYTLKQTKSIKN